VKGRLLDAPVAVVATGSLGPPFFLPSSCDFSIGSFLVTPLALDARTAPVDVSPGFVVVAVEEVQSVTVSVVPGMVVTASGPGTVRTTVLSGWVSVIVLPGWVSVSVVPSCVMVSVESGSVIVSVEPGWVSVIVVSWAVLVIVAGGVASRCACSTHGIVVVSVVSGPVAVVVTSCSVAAEAECWDL
jgi:hypothetical protein